MAMVPAVTSPSEEVLHDLLTTSDLCEIFRRSSLTILHWRKHKQLPYIRIPGNGRDTIRYRRESIMTWALENKKRIALQA